MDTVEKMRVLLPHWLEHNRQHMEEFRKWEAMLRNEGETELAQRMAEIINLAQTTDDVLEKALEEAGGPLEGGGQHHHHHGGE